MRKVTSSWFFLSTLNYDARSTTHQIRNNKLGIVNLFFFLYLCVQRTDVNVSYCFIREMWSCNLVLGSVVISESSSV